MVGGVEMLRRTVLLLVVVFPILCLSASSVLADADLAATTERVSVSSAEAEGNYRSNWSSVSADGRYVAFSSLADNLVAGDTNGVVDVFVRDRVTGITDRVSVSGAGEQGNDWSNWPSISADGRYVAFMSTANNLVAGDTNGSWDVFVRDRVSGETERVNVSSAGAEANGPSGYSVISADGRYVAFMSDATNLVPGDTNGRADVFVRDRMAGETQRVSVSSAGVEADGRSDENSISADGRYVAFGSRASNLVPGDTNGTRDIFVRGPLEYYDGPPPTFDDVSPSFWAFDEVEACAAAGIVSGYGDGLYHPELGVTRDQMAVYISRALAGGDENVPDFTATPTFPDVGDTHWALKYVEYAVSCSVVSGYLDGTYRPEYPVTRDQMAVYVARSICDPTGEDGLTDYVPADPRNFPDVSSGFWSYKHVEYCVENGVVAGYLDGYYRPDYVVTRDQMAVYVARAFGLMP
jgi:archaellum component FlaF (FlaF/FlaG flagellin family)